MMQHREPRAMTTSASKLERWDQVRARDRKALANLRAAGRRVDCESWSAEVGRMLTPRAMSRSAACSDS
jgi:hypothetical protein